MCVCVSVCVLPVFLGRYFNSRCCCCCSTPLPTASCTPLSCSLTPSHRREVEKSPRMNSGMDRRRKAPPTLTCASCCATRNCGEALMHEDGAGRTAAVFRVICTTTRTVCSCTMWRGVGWSRSTEAASSPLSSFTSLFVCSKGVCPTLPPHSTAGHSRQRTASRTNTHAQRSALPPQSA